MHKLCFDCETSGIDPKKHGPLTIYFGVWDDTDKLIDELYLFVKPDPGKTIENDLEAAKVTGIDFNKHINDPNTITYSDAQIKLIEFLQKNKIKGKRKHFLPVGQNLEFDLNMIFEHIISKQLWQANGVHYRKMDTLEIVTFLQQVGILPAKLGRLQSLVEYFNIENLGYHDAKADVHMTFAVYKSLRDMIKNVMSNSVNNNLDQNLLDIIER